MRAVVISLVLACGHSAAPQEHAAPTPSAAADDCPATLPGTSLTVEDVDKGAAIVFVTTGSVRELRRRVQAWIDHKMVETPNVASGDPIPRGMRATFVAPEPNDVAKLQSELRMHAQHLASGTCKMAM